MYLSFVPAVIFRSILGTTKAIPTTLSSREGAIDTLLRFAQGLDDNSPSLTLSAFTPTAICNLRALSTNARYPLPELQGQDAIVSFFFPKIGEMDTTHMMSNFRVEVDSDRESHGNGNGKEKRAKNDLLHARSAL